jgi:integrase
MSTHYLKHHWKPLHRLPLKTVGRDVIASRLRAITRESGPSAANWARSTLSAMYAWAIGEGLCDANPVLATNQATEKKARERVLSDSELAAIWNSAPDNDYGRIVRLLMLTGQRRHEIGGLRWSEIDFDAKVISLPGERTKNGKRHDVPLYSAAMDIINSTTERRDPVFGEGRNGFASYAQAKQLLDQKTGINEPWALHDLRGTAATGMADLGVQPHVIEAVLNHISGHKAGVAGIYNRASDAPDKRAALNLWANYLAVVVAQASGANVTMLKA